MPRVKGDTGLFSKYFDITPASAAPAVWGTTYNMIGVYGGSDRWKGVVGNSRESIGVEGYSEQDTGVYGTAWNLGGVGVGGFGDTGVLGWGNDGVAGWSVQGNGVSGASSDGYGVFGSSDEGDAVVGYKTTDTGVAGSFTNVTASTVIYHEYKLNQAARFWGHVKIVGNLFVTGTKGFRIDHPLDPANKFLSHAAVESPDMKTMYDGIALLDRKGEATITLPTWFGALNTELRYQLTPIGSPSPDLHIADEVSNNQFRIGGGIPGTKVSWQVTGIRQDAWARKHRMPVEERKSRRERGRYLHPELHVTARGKKLDSVLSPELVQALRRGGAAQERRARRGKVVRRESKIPGRPPRTRTRTGPRKSG